ncbi:ASCH domain-containing protein [Vibrio rotiferianus]|jgi:hypothetical protein|uniref:ASCH domain-containing protein n=1 Tax=Vibrio rotiferianus TaxID=190895 RepID=UPI0011107978|nr:ASCH domain-containing protein [Vibrio rotiferianus]TMX42473.1 ASCH domain-containing protein [Vibrio rotiferianus]TMX43464.1 ASCH domain-containing protein [Vibrio rotiferianus]TMX59620.1 ASCH domain-containing protein [Vibrio rotiferianus]
MAMEDRLKALSVVEPWGSMIADEIKLLEIRSWEPEQLPLVNVALVQNTKRLTKDGDEDFDGRVIAIIDIVSCAPWEKEDCRYSGCDESDFEEGWLAWKLANIRKLDAPVIAVAKRKFYDLTNEEVLAVKQELEVHQMG